MSYAIDTCIVDFLAACGPQDTADIIRECRIQSTDDVTSVKVCQTLARLLLLGSIELYDGIEGCYDIATGEL